jgi:hypothetical protein
VDWSSGPDRPRDLSYLIDPPEQLAHLLGVGFRIQFDDIADPVRPPRRGIKVAFGRNADTVESDPKCWGLAIDVVEYATSRC